jgi:hypothetical protein
MTIDELRTERNRRLAETDFYALKDVHMPPVMQMYREQLRDLPAKEDLDLDNVVWPTKP